jgi:alpha-ribazole phosphatase/probable phosphoglycerate mutase
MELGPWEGMSEDDIALKYTEEWKIWRNRPAELKLTGRETLHKLLERVLMGVQNTFRREGDRNIVVITHVAVIRVLLLWHSKKSLNLYNTIHVPNGKVFDIRINTCT